MLKLISKILKFSTFPVVNRLILFRVFNPTSVFLNRLKMAGVSSKMKSDVKLEENPVKKIKLTLDVATRTVATMCGAWRPEEEDGGMILVFQTRKPCLSPDPEKETDFPENIEDFWDAALHCSGDEQTHSSTFPTPLTPEPTGNYSSATPEPPTNNEVVRPMSESASEERHERRAEEEMWSDCVGDDGLPPASPRGSPPGTPVPVPSAGDPPADEPTESTAPAEPLLRRQLRPRKDVNYKI